MTLQGFSSNFSEICQIGSLPLDLPCLPVIFDLKFFCFSCQFRLSQVKVKEFRVISEILESVERIFKMGRFCCRSPSKIIGLTVYGEETCVSSSFYEYDFSRDGSEEGNDVCLGGEG